MISYHNEDSQFIWFDGSCHLFGLDDDLTKPVVNAIFGHDYKFDGDSISMGNFGLAFANDEVADFYEYFFSMGTKIKYLIYENPKEEMIHPVIFSGSLEHRRIKGVLECAARRITPLNFLSGGFVGSDAFCSGESISTGLKSRGSEDSRIVTLALQ